MKTRTSWYQEYLRYERMAWIINGTAMRRGALALMLVTVLFFLIRRTRTRELLDVPARSLAIGLPLLVVTWSKLPTHFGVFIGVAAVAAGTEAARMKREAGRAASLSLWVLVYLTALFVAAGWSWALRAQWGPIDLGTLDWRFDFETKPGVPLQLVAALLPVVALFAVMVVNLIRRGDPGFPGAPWRVASWAAPLLMVPLITLTLTVFAVDTARSSPWTIRRQNLDALVGRHTCGLADHVVVSAGGRTTGLARLLEAEGARVFVGPDVFPYVPCARQPRLRDGIAEAPDYALTSSIYSDPFLHAGSPFHGVLDLYRVERLRVVGPYSPAELRIYAVEQRIPGAIELAPDSTATTG